ncbi:MAG: hypothetical protein WA885_11200 [Phormidesmis sp.]
MKPASPAFEDDDSRLPDLSSSSSDSKARLPPAPAASSSSTSNPSAPNPNPNPSPNPLEQLQRRYTDQLSQEIERLEARKAQLEAEVFALREDCEQLQNAVPLLPGEDRAAIPAPEAAVSAVKQPSRWRRSHRSIELPMPATSELRRQENMPPRSPTVSVDLRKGLILSAIATLLMAWHLGIVSALGQGGSWLGLSVGQLGAGFVPAVALLWMRMLVIVPALGILAPQLYADTWEDLQDWIYTRDRLLLLLIGSGIALFFSQVFLYQSTGVVGPLVGATLLFLYPLTAVPLGWLARQTAKISPLGWLAMVAIAMGGLLMARPSLGSATAHSIWLGIAASAAFSVYIVLTNVGYREQCHPIPVSVVQFSTVAVLSSLVLLVKPLTPIEISWLGFALWGLALGIVMLLTYLLSYGSLRMIGGRTAMLTASTPLVVALIAWSFTPAASLEIIQWTGLLLVAIGGIALSNEKLANGKSP